MQSSLAVHLILTGPPFPFEHAFVVDRAMPVLDMVTIAQLHLGRTPTTTPIFQVGHHYYAAPFTDTPVSAGFSDLDTLDPATDAGISRPGTLTVGELRNFTGPLRLLISELDGWVFDVALKPFHGAVPSQFRHPAFEQGFIPAPGTSTFQLANFMAPRATPSRARELQQFRVAAKYEPEVPDVDWELSVAMAMRAHGLAVTQLSELLQFMVRRPHLRVLHLIVRDLATQQILIGSQGFPPVKYVRGLVAQTPNLADDPFVANNPEHITRSSQVTILRDIIHAGEQLRLFTGSDSGELHLTRRGRRLSAPDEKTEASALFTVELALWLADQENTSFRTTTKSNTDLAEVIDFRNYRSEA